MQRTACFWKRLFCLGFLIQIIIGSIYLSQIPLITAFCLNSTIPKSVENNPANLTYLLEYSITNDYGSEQNNLVFSMGLIGNHGFYENGTIDYYHEEDITSMVLIQTLQSMPNLGEWITAILSDHSIRSYFSNRRESLDLDDFSDNASYTIFWLNSLDQPPDNLAPNKNVKFFRVNSPIALMIQDTFPEMAAWFWTTESADLREDVPLLRVFYLRFFKYIENDEELTVRLYYDMNYTILVRAEIIYNNLSPGSNEHYNMVLRLRETNLDFSFLPNPYHLAWRNQVILITVYSLCGATLGLIISFIIYRKWKVHNLHLDKKKQSSFNQMLDRI